MAKHKVYARHNGVGESDRLSIPLIKRCVRDSLCIEGVNVPCEVNVLIIDDEGIREINSEFRNIDKPTDVLSFPMLEFPLPGWANPGADAIDPETGLIPLGEIVFSGERVFRQAREFGQSIDQETAYLTVHSVLHLLGYDHIDEGDGKRLMRSREKAILLELGLRDQD